MEQFKENDLVWAKIRGYPPWPAKVESVPRGSKAPNNKFYIMFFGSHDHAWLTAGYLCPYDEYLEKYNVPRKGLPEAVSEAEEYRAQTRAHSVTCAVGCDVAETSVHVFPKPRRASSKWCRNRKRRITVKQEAPAEDESGEESESVAVPLRVEESNNDEQFEGTAVNLAEPHEEVNSSQLHKEIADLISTTLRGIVAESIEKISCSENLWTLSDWSWVQRVSGSKVVYKGTALTVEEVTQSFQTAEREMEVCRSLLPHPHLRLVRARLGTSPSTLLHSCGTLYFLKDHGEAIPLTYLLQDKSKLLTPKAYLHLVLSCLVQVFSAIAYLHSNGICHRNVTMDTLCATPHGSEWLVAIGDLHSVLQRPPPITGQWHMYNLSELKWSNISVAPPEVVTAPNHSSKTLDCSLVNSFALGCLIYNMMGEPHPFERNPRLLTQGYAHRDLLPFATDPASARSVTLLWLAQQLLAHDPRARMTVHTGLILCQALLWLPPKWFQEPVPARALQHYLAYEQAAMVSAVAKQRDTTLGNILKMQFLLDTSLNDLLHSLSLVWQR